MEYKPVSTIQLQKIVQSVKRKYDTDVPTYEAKIAGGGTQIYEYNIESIQDEKTPEKDIEKWAKYQSQLSQMETEITEKSSAYLIYKGVECGEIPDDWFDEQKWLGVDIPDSKFDLKVRYVFTEILKSPQDIKNAIAKIMELSLKGVDKTAIEAAEESFPDIL